MPAVKQAPKTVVSKPKAAKTPPVSPVFGRGSVTGQTYRNVELRFDITFPDTWLIAGKDFESEMKKGFRPQPKGSGICRSSGPHTTRSGT